MQANACLLTCSFLPAYIGSDETRSTMSDADKVFKALADGNRRRVLDVLAARNGQTLGALCEHLDMTRQSATQHIDLLVDANLVTIVWRGREKLHFLNPVPIHEAYDRWVKKFERNRLKFLADLKSLLEGDGNDKT
jgi:DNA-binding transcriptional ArsR family regulator